MRYLRATFKNYIGFYNGMDLTTVDIDFTKCNHNIVVINGANGSGKSTLLYHLNPFPDGSSSFIPDRTAEKNLVLLSEGDVYNIQIISPADLKGRKTTKAYIQKNGVELNENGNVSSYKDIIFSEFELDSNFISLSRLSNDDKGLGNKTPAVRKKFVSDIIDNLEIYNSMYKTLNKKSLVYKSHINTLHTKIQNIGSKDSLEARLSSLQSRESELNKSIMSINNQIVAIQAKNSIDEKEALEIQRLTDELSRLEIELKSIEVKMDGFFNKTKISQDNIKAKYENDSRLLERHSSKVEELNNILIDKSNRLSEVSKSILSIEAELVSMDSNDNISERYNQNKSNIAEIKNELKAINIPDDVSLVFGLSNLSSFCDKFASMIDVFNDGLTPKELELLVHKQPKQIVTELQAEQTKLISEIEKTKAQIENIQGQMKVLAVLDNRPKKCNIDNCIFIADALRLKKSIKTDLIEDLSVAQEKSLELSKNLTDLQFQIDCVNELVPKKMQLDSIMTLVSENSNILSVIYPDFLSNLDNMIISMNNFSEIRDHKRIIDGINLLKMLDSELQLNNVLEVEYKGFKEKIQLINSSKAMMKKLKDEEAQLNEVINSTRNELNQYTKLRDNLSANIGLEIEYSNCFNLYCSIKKDYDYIKSKVEEYNKKSSKALEALSSINSMRTEIDRLSRELNPIMQDISTISGQLTLLDSYYAEYNEYKQSYDMIETLKKYCSPTGGGIQTLFMQIYMNKTKEMSNQVLGMLFNGNYQLLDFVINESEFRIPFIGEGLPVDDISSGSSSQVCMMSMIINLVLMHQASSKFNIAQLDEIDGPLDSHNKSNFVNILFHIMNILEIEQLFLISHSIELDNSFADMIKLKDYDAYESSIKSGNIIWDYKDAIKQ